MSLGKGPKYLTSSFDYADFVINIENLRQRDILHDSMIPVIMVHDFESFPEFRFVEQEIDDGIKLRMLYAELNRLERTIEIHGNPYIFVDDEEIRFSPEAGVERFEGHRSWLKDLLCDDTLSEADSAGKLDMLRSVLDRLSSKETHPYVLLILAQIVVLTGVSTLCSSP